MVSRATRQCTQPMPTCGMSLNPTRAPMGQAAQTSFGYTHGGSPWCGACPCFLRAEPLGERGYPQCSTR